MTLPFVEKDQRLQLLESELERRIFSIGNRLGSARALEHLKYGLGARHDVLRSCWHCIERTYFVAKDEPLSVAATVEAAFRLNGYYLHLRGVLDNLAWILQAELRLFSGVTEDSRERMKVHLFGKEFLSALDQRSPRLAARLRRHTDWGLDLAKFRDPAAHRIPLFVPPGVITTQQQYDEFKRLDSLSGALAEQLGGKRRVEVLLEARNVAAFRPVFCVTAADGIKVFSISKQLLYDHRRYLHVSRKVLESFQ